MTPSPGGAQGDILEAGGRSYRDLSGESPGRRVEAFATPGEAGPAATTRIERFHSLASGLPSFGGVVLGNVVKGPPGKLRDARFVLKSETLLGQEVLVPVLEVRIESKSGQRLYRYDDWTPGELWSAYYFVRPRLEWAAIGVMPGGGGLVGKAECPVDPGSAPVWCFAVHPAIANTPLASDAMALDWLIAARGAGDDSVAALLSRADGDIDTYQWLSAAATVQTVGAGLTVTAGGTGGARSVLGLRLIKVVPGRSETIDTPPEHPATKAFVAVAYRDCAVVRRIDRFARAVALVNWLYDSGVLPSDLPPVIQPSWLKVEPRMSEGEALARLAGQPAARAVDRPAAGPAEKSTEDAIGNLRPAADNTTERVMGGIGFVVLGFGLLALKWRHV